MKPENPLDENEQNFMIGPTVPNGGALWLVRIWLRFPDGVKDIDPYSNSEAYTWFVCSCIFERNEECCQTADMFSLILPNGIKIIDIDGDPIL